MEPTPRFAEGAQDQTHHSRGARAWNEISSKRFEPIRGASRLLRGAYVLSGIFLTTFALYPFLVAFSLLRYRRGQRLIPVVYHRIMRRLLGLTISVIGSPSRRRPLCLVANHTSWLDIIVISSSQAVVFVAKQEVAGWPFFGWLAQLQRSIFVDREKRHQVRQTVDSIADALLGGEVVGIFPEGTSTDGLDVAPFRSALMGAVHETLRRGEGFTEMLIQPVSVTYVGPKRRLAVWALEDEIPFFAHLLQVAGLGRIDVALTWGEPITADINSDRKVLTKRLEEVVRGLVANAHKAFILEH